MNELKKELIEQMRDMAINDLKNVVDDDQIDDIVSSATNKLSESGQYCQPSSLYFKSPDISELDKNAINVVDVANEAIELVRTYFDESLSDVDILISIVESGKVASNDETIKFVEIAIRDHRKFVEFMKSQNNLDG